MPSRSPVIWWRVFVGMRSRNTRPTWLPDAKLRVDDVTFSWQLGHRWGELFVLRPRCRYVSLVSVVPRQELLWGTEAEKVEYLMGVFDKLPAPGTNGDACKLPEDPRFVKKFPGLWELLTQTKYPDESPRERSSLTLFVEEGVFKLVVSEKTRELSCWATGPTFEGALDALEKRLTSDSPEWRSRPSGKKKKG
jgi:hypothetical protein